MAACVCHLCVFGVLVCWSSANHQQTVCGRMCMSAVRVCCSCLLVICRSPTDNMWPHVYVICACLVFLSVGDLQITNRQEHQTRTDDTHAATYCVIIQNQRTQISERNSNGTKHSGGPPEDGREKRPKHVGVLYLQTRF